MEPLSIVSLATTYIRIINNLASINEDSGSISVQKVLSELRILNAIMLESTSIISELGGTAPESVEVALLECRATGHELRQLVEKVRPERFVGRKKNSLRFALFWELRQSKIKELLESFRTSCHLLRQIAADAMTHSLLRRQMFQFEDFMQLNFEQSNAGTEQPPNRDEIETSVASGTENLSSNQEPPGRRKSKIPSQPPIQSQPVEFNPYLQPGTICFSTPGERHATWHPVKITLDTAGDFEVVSRATLNEMGVHGPFARVPRTMMTLKGEHQLDEVVTLKWSFDKSSEIYNTQFYLVDVDLGLLVGAAFIEKNRLKEAKLRLFYSRFWRTTGRSVEETLRTRNETEDLDEAAWNDNPYNAIAPPTPMQISVAAAANPGAMNTQAPNADNGLVQAASSPTSTASASATVPSTAATPTAGTSTAPASTAPTSIQPPPSPHKPIVNLPVTPRGAVPVSSG